METSDMIQVRGQRWWSTCRGMQAILAILTLAAGLGWIAESARANDDASFPIMIGDSAARRSMVSFDDLAGMDGQPSMTSELRFPADALPDDGDVDACDPAGRCETVCNRPGLFQELHDRHLNGRACWVGRADALLLWRDAPPSRMLVVTGDGTGTPLLNANQLQSTATGGVRGSLVRVDGCSGNAWEIGYLFAGNFTAGHPLPFDPTGPAYALAEPGIYGLNTSQPFSSGNVTLLAQMQGAEFNRHLAAGPNLRWLAGFRWLQWQEAFTLTDRLDDGVNLLDDSYNTQCINNLYGGQIGADAKLLGLRWLRVDSVVKAGAYYNNAVQASRYTLIDYINPANSRVAAMRVGQSPAACSFVGEVGITGVIPLGQHWDVRVGYFGLWLTGLAQPVQQLSGQDLTATPGVGTLTANGGTLVQGLTLGLEGRW